MREPRATSRRTKRNGSVGGILAGYSSPVLDGDRFYLIDNGANLTAFDFATGTELWKLNLGTIQRASPVLADGKLYVGTVNGTFFIIEPSEDGAKILDRDELTAGEEFEEIYASVAISDGRVYLATAQALYAIGKERRSGNVRGSKHASERHPGRAGVVAGGTDRARPRPRRVRGVDRASLRCRRAVH